jgi:hypothetical protein
MKKSGFKPFLMKYCQFVEPAYLFYHRRLQERLAALDLRRSQSSALRSIPSGKSNYGHPWMPRPN